MIEEFIAIIISLVSLCLYGGNGVHYLNDAKDNVEEQYLASEEFVHHENDCNNEELAVMINASEINYSANRNLKTARSFWKSLKTSVTITAIIIPICFALSLIIYLDFRVTNVCFLWQEYNNTVPLPFFRIRLIGSCVEVLIICVFSSLYPIFYIGWRDFKTNYTSVLYIGIISGLITVIYKTFLFIFGYNESYDLPIHFRLPPNIIFITLQFANAIYVSKKLLELRSNVMSTRKLILVLVSQIIFVTVFGFLFYYVLIPYFVDLKNEFIKAIVAALTPLSILIPSAICYYLALWTSQGIIADEHAFVLACATRNVAIFLYRLMQADIQNIWIFMALSLLHGCLNVAKKATENFFYGLWKKFILFLKTTFVCCRQLELKPRDTARHYRFIADMDIHEMLNQNATIVINQMFIIIFSTVYFNAPYEDFLNVFLKRLFIALLIDLVFNIMANFVQIHYHNIPINKVWCKNWRRHFIASAFLLALYLTYFSQVLLPVLKVHTKNIQETYNISSCSIH